MSITIERGPKLVNLTSPLDEHELELDELRDKVAEAERSLEETRYRFLRDGIISFEDVQRMATKLSEKHGCHYLASDISEMFVAGDIDVDEFFEDGQGTDKLEDVTGLDECCRYKDGEHIPGT